MLYSEALAEVLIDLSDALVHDFDLIEVLNRVAVHTAVVSEADLVGIMLADKHHRPQFMVATDETGPALELFQLQTREGPCVDALDLNEPVINVDLRAASGVWPHFAAAAHDHGYSSVHALPLRPGGTAVGALVLLSRTCGTFTLTEVNAVQALADLATIALMQERAPARHEVPVENLQGALNDRVTVEQAKGVLAQRSNLSMDEAFHVLRCQAAASNLKLVDCAAAVLKPFHPEQSDRPG